MRRSELRQKILDECPEECPEEFWEYLGNWIDEIEKLAKEPLDTLDRVKGVDDLQLIKDARDDLYKLCVALY